MVSKPPVPGSRKRAPAKPKSLRVEVASGDQRRALEALRDRLASEIDRADEKGVAVLAQIAAQLRAVLKELAGLPEAKAVSKADELAARRKARRAKAATSASAAGEGRK